MEILELKLLQNRENIQQKIENLEKEENYLENHSKSLELSELLNSMAIILIGDEKIQESLELLRRAETLAHNSTRHKSISFNTIATFYRRQGKIITSLKYIERSISVHPCGSAYLNLCSVLNIQGKFEKALEIAMHTIIFVQDEIIEENVDFHQVSPENSEILAVAFYNLAVQLEYLKRTDEAASYYRKAVEFSSKYLPQTNCIREILKQIYEKVVAGHSKVETRNKTENKPQANPVTQAVLPSHAQHAPNIKKRVVIKGNRSKSPAPKSPLAVKEPSEKKLNRNPTSHRKFIKVGITKAKFIENYAAASAKGDESADEHCKSTSRSMKFEKNQSEISFKSKIEEGFKKKELAKEKVEPGKTDKGKKTLKFHRVQSEKIKKGEEMKTENLLKNEENKKPLVIPTPTNQSFEPQPEVLDSRRNKNLEEYSKDSSFENITENEELEQKAEFFNGPNLSPVPKNYSLDMEKFLIVTGENFNEMVLDDEDQKHQSIKEPSIKSNKSDSHNSSKRAILSKNSSIRESDHKLSIFQPPDLEKNESVEENLEKNESVEENLEKESQSSEKDPRNERKLEDSGSEKSSFDKNSNHQQKIFDSNENQHLSNSHHDADSDQSIELTIRNNKKSDIEQSLTSNEEKVENTEEQEEKSNDQLEDNDIDVKSQDKDHEKEDKSQEINEKELKNSEDIEAGSENSEINNGNILNDSDEDFEKNSEKEMLQMTAERSMRFVVRSTKSNKDSLFDSFHLPKRVNNSHHYLAKHL